MRADTVKTSIVNEHAKDVANDLSLLNGVSNRVNLEYLKNLQNIYLYNATESILNGEEYVDIDFPFVGILHIERQLKNTTKKNNGPSYDIIYTFKPSTSFAKSVRNVFEEGVCPLPEMLSEKYGKRLLNMYEKYLEEE